MISEQDAAAGLSQTQTGVMQRAESRLMAPCCYTQTIDLHRSEIADQMRVEVAEMARAGQSELEILDHYKHLYGEQILAVPDGMLGQVAFGVPVTVTTLGAGLLGWTMYRWHRRRNQVAFAQPSAPGATEPPADRAMLEKIRRETEW